MYLRCCPGDGAGEAVPYYRGCCTHSISPSLEPSTLLMAKMPSTISRIPYAGLMPPPLPAEECLFWVQSMWGLHFVLYKQGNGAPMMGNHEST